MTHPESDGGQKQPKPFSAVFIAIVGAAVFDGLSMLLLWRVLKGAGFSATTTATATVALLVHASTLHFVCSHRV